MPFIRGLTIDTSNDIPLFTIIGLIILLSASVFASLSCIAYYIYHSKLKILPKIKSIIRYIYNKSIHFRIKYNICRPKEKLKQSPHLGPIHYSDTTDEIFVTHNEDTYTSHKINYEAIYLDSGYRITTYTVIEYIPENNVYGQEFNESDGITNI